VALSKTLKRMVEGSHHDPLGLDSHLQKFVMAGGGFTFSKDTRKLARRLLGEDVRHRNPDIFHASAAGDCRRKQLLALYHPDFERVDPLAAVQRMGDGKWGHLKWQLTFHQMGILRESEFQVLYKPWNAGGAPDGVLVLPWLDKTKFLLEVKTVSDRRFGEILRNNAPERSFILQTHTYIQALDLSNIIYWIENKATNDWIYFWQKRDYEVIKYLRKRYKKLNEARREGVLLKPDCTFLNKDPMYYQCHFKKLCINLLKEDGVWQKYKPQK
jgi:hypothetical protein